MRTSSTDLAALPEVVRRHALGFPNGEVAWPNAYAEQAINALADAGHVTLGLDARTPNDAEAITEVPVSALQAIVSEHRSDAVERARDESLAALPRALSSGTHVLITWG